MNAEAYLTYGNENGVASLNIEFVSKSPLLLTMSHNCHTMLNSYRIQQEIKMADVIPETDLAIITDLE